MSTKNIIGNQQPISLPLKNIPLRFLYFAFYKDVPLRIHAHSSTQKIFLNACQITSLRNGTLSELLEHVHNMLCSEQWLS